MSTFTYRVLNPNDRKYETGEMEAGSADEVAEKLRRAGFTPVEINIKTGGNLDLAKYNIAFERVKVQELAFFTEQFATMLGAGMSPLKSLDTIERGTKNALLKRTVAAVRSDLNQGATLPQAMRKHPKVFDNLYVSLVQAGDTGGKLEKALVELADMLQKAAQLKREVRSALMYPAIVLFFATIIFFAMMFFVVPAFQDIFDSNGGELPGLTKILVAISTFCKKFWFTLPLFPAGAFFAWKKWVGTESGRWQWDSLKFKVPKIKELVEMIVTARVMRTLSTLLDSGVPILQALEITGPVANNVVVEAALQQAYKDISQGADIAYSLLKTGVFPTMAEQMILAGEQAGELEKMMNNVAGVYELQVQNSIKTIKAIMEPVMMVVIGGIIAVTVIGLYLPIFKVYNTIK